MEKVTLLPSVSEKFLNMDEYITRIHQEAILTHLLLDKMAAIPQTIYLDAFSWIKSFVFRLKFHWSLFLRIQVTITQNWFK